MKINNMKDLREERRMLKMEIRATEHLLLNTIRRSKKDAVSSIAGELLPAFTPSRMISGATSMLSQSSDKKGKWWKILLPLIPVVMQLFDKDKDN